MSVREVLKRSDAVVGAVRDFRRFAALATMGYGRRGKIRRYLASHTTRKLLLGAGTTAIPGWLCTDVMRLARHLVYLDATRPFPFEDHTFDYVFSEHMIEHISWPKGSLMLKECRRVLKPGGTLRIATPDLQVILGLYGGDRDGPGARYVEWMTNKYLPGVNRYKASFVINNAFRNWGHEFLYDEDLLVTALTEAGFVRLRRCVPGQSDDENLRDIEAHGRNVGDEDINRFETMVFEGDTPA